MKKILLGRAPETPLPFTFQLKALNGGPMPAGSKNGIKTVTILGAGEQDFGNILFDTPGEYVYAISEVTGSASGYSYDESLYILTYTVAEKNGVLRSSRSYTKDGDSETYGKAEFINKYRMPGKEEEFISGYKKWNHGDNPEERRPESITVYIKKDGNVIDQTTVTAADNWVYSFSLPKYEKDGKTMIQYEIEEGNVPHYTHEMEGNNLINTYKGPDYPGDNPPGTGDPLSPIFWLFVMLLSLAALAVIITINAMKAPSKKQTGTNQ